MKKKLIAICLSAFMLTSVTSVNCMAENPYPDEESYSNSSFDILQDILRENDCQAGIAFLGYIGYDATTEEILDYTNQEDYVASYPFLKNGTVVDAGGYEVFAIVPASDWSINVYSSEMTEDASYKDYLDSPLYKGSPDEVIILRCNLSEIYSNTMVTSKEGNMSVTYRPSISLKDGHLAEEQHCYDFSIYYDFDYGHNGSDNCMESNLPEDYYEDYYSDTVQNAYELLCSTDEVSYYLGLGFFVWYTGNKDMIDDKECRVFVLGKDLDDHIEVKNHYAVSDNQVYYLDVIENTWNILGSG